MGVVCSWQFLLGGRLSQLERAQPSAHIAVRQRRIPRHEAKRRKFQLRLAQFPGGHVNYVEERLKAAFARRWGIGSKAPLNFSNFRTNDRRQGHHYGYEAGILREAPVIPSVVHIIRRPS
jgi:hypothetical protein